MAESLKAASLALAGKMRRGLPAPLVGAAVAVVADIGWMVLAMRRRALARNLRWLVADAATTSSRATFRHFVRCSLDVLALPGLTRTDVLEWVDVSGFPLLERALRQGRGAVVVGAHLGNYELVAVILAASGVSTCVMVEAIDPARDALFAACRSGTGVRVIPTTAGAPREALRCLREGQVLVVAGDRPLRSKRSLTVPFARGRRSLPIGPAWLALHSGAPVLTAHVVLSPGAQRPYRGLIEPEISTADLGADPIGMLTRRIAERLSAAVVRHPDQWFVFDANWQQETPR